MLNQKNVRMGLALIFLVLSVSVTNAWQLTLKINPNPANIEVGESLKLEVAGLDASNKRVEGSIAALFTLRDSGFVPSSGILSDTTGMITGKVPGVYRMVLFYAAHDGSGFGREYVDVTVRNKPIAVLALKNLPERISDGAVIPLDLEVKDEADFLVANSDIKITSSNPKVATIDNLLNFYALEPGKTSVVMQAGKVKTQLDIAVVKNEVAKIALSVDKEVARTGDVLHFNAKTWDKEGKEIANPYVSFAVNSAGSNSSAGAGATIDNEGAFVAEVPGTYTIVAYAGSNVSRKAIKITPRDVQREIEMVGKGSVTTMRTTDFWVWEGLDKRDYAVTGTLAAGGQAFFWDVTNPAAIKKVDSVAVDARSVNDVKVSEDGKICVISSEGASNRKNGITVLDVSNPTDVQILSRFSDGLTGGIHNLFIYDQHVYALSNGQRYDIISIKDPKNPVRVGRFEIDNPARSIHDVWVVDGIAYSSNWNDGLILVDVGNGIAGGSPSNPVEISRTRIEGDANHTAFPFKNKTTGQNIVIAGDEIFPVDFDLEEVIMPRGYLHFIDYTDLKNPREIARYQVPEAGSHNFWVKDDLLYIGYYNGGLRVVDISGELKGDLYKQGREVAFFLPLDKKGYHANNAMTWGAMPHKGHIFFSDLNSGLWSVKLSPIKPENTSVEVK